MWYTTSLKRKDYSHWSSQNRWEKSFDKIKHPFMIKILMKVLLKGTYNNIVTAIYDKPTANIILNVKSLPTKIWNKRRRSTLTTSIQHIIRCPRHTSQTRKRKGIQSGREEVKLSYADDIENPKESTQKSLELISEFSYVARYKLTHRN